jgi:NAD(P)H-hydrate epimerase
LSPQPSPLRPPILLDADALNVLAALIAEGYGFDADSAVPAPAPHLILTPHAGELARLLEAAKATDAQQLARQLNAVVVAKGPETLIASPSRSHLFTAGTPALATAGTGDVLAGVIGAFAAQGVPPFDAAVLGVELHGRAGRHAEQHLGQRSVRAEDVTASLPLVLQHLER